MVNGRQKMHMIKPETIRLVIKILVTMAFSFCLARMERKHVFPTTPRTVSKLYEVTRKAVISVVFLQNWGVLLLWGGNMV